MRNSRWWLVLGAFALLGVGGVIGAAMNGRGIASIGSHAPATSKAAAPIPVPDGDRVMRDLLGATTTGLPRTSPGERVEVWATREFFVGGVRYHSVFFGIKKIERPGVVADCRGCSPILASVTYREESAGWKLDSRDLSIAELGSYGKLPPAEKMITLSLGDVTAFAVEDRWAGQGAVFTGATLIVYRSGWKNSGWIELGMKSASTTPCEMDRACYSWHGNLKVLKAGPGELPNISVERAGLEFDEQTQSARPVSNLTYQFNGSKYVKIDIPAIATPSPGEAPARSEVAGSSTQIPISEVSGRQWYTPDVNFTRCIRSRSPADRIQMIQDYGKSAKVVDLPNGAVEISEQTNSFEERFWVYYPSNEACNAALPRSQPIPSRYR